jgi:hypothetical protein
MSSRLVEIFEDEALVAKIQRRLPYLFQLAELESSRAGKVGMQVGSAREQILIALLMYKFGEVNVEAEIPVTMPEVDVRLFGVPVSIKTITGRGFAGVKLSWTVDSQKAKQFQESYCPRCDILLVQVNWNASGGLYYIPLEAQRRLFDQIGRRRYIKLPKPGTNPRGIEISTETMARLVDDEQTRRVVIEWRRVDIRYNPYKRWVDLWEEE